MATPMRSTDFRSVVEPILNETFDGIYNVRKDEWAQVPIARRIAVLRDANSRGGSTAMHDTVKEGDTIKSGDIIAEIETDKATMEVEAVDEGVLAKILVAAGTQDVAVNTRIAIIAFCACQPQRTPRRRPQSSAGWPLLWHRGPRPRWVKSGKKRQST